MFEGVLAADPDARTKGIRDPGEDVFRAAGAIGVGEGLHAQCRRRENEIIALAGQFLGDGVRRRHVAFGIVTANRDRPVGNEAFLAQADEHSVDALVDDVLRGVLQDGDAGQSVTFRGTNAAVRKQQCGGGAGDERNTDEKTFECGPHCRVVRTRSDAFA